MDYVNNTASVSSAFGIDTDTNNVTASSWGRFREVLKKTVDDYRIIEPMYQSKDTLWSLRKAILRENFFVLFGYVNSDKLQSVKEGYATFTQVDDHLSHSSLDAAISEFEHYNIKDFNISIIEYLQLPYDIRNQMVEAVKRVLNEKANTMNNIVNSVPGGMKPSGL